MTFAHDMASANGIEPSASFLRFWDMRFALLRGTWIDRAGAIIREWKALQ